MQQQLQMATVLTLIGMIYEAVWDASVWQAFLDAFVIAMGGRRGALGLSAGHREGSVMFRWSGWPDEDIRLYSERYMEADPLRIRMEELPEGVIQTSHDYCPDHVESVAYREFYGPRGVHYGCLGVFLRTAGGMSMINAVRAEQDGCFGEREMAILRPIMPHLRRAALLHSELSSLRVQLAAFTGHLDRCAYAFLITDPQGHVMYRNLAASQIIGAKDGVAIASGQLSLMSAKANSAFQTIVGQVAINRDNLVRRLDVQRPSGKESYRLLLVPVPHSEAMPLGLPHPSVTILIIESQSGAELDLSVLREMFSLTPAEARVTGKLIQGRSAEEIAVDLGLSVGTVRTHIRRVLSKTATGRQGELISLVLRLLPFRVF
jgi:DNA-binding CsgD family transcriptional regulator